MPITNLNSTMLSLRLQLNSNINTIDTSLRRMSSGLKISSAIDGAAQVVLSSKLNTRISGMDIAQNNVQQAISMLNCADSSISDMLEITNRIRDLSLQAMNGTYSDDERKVMQDEADILLKELQRQKNSTKHNGISIFNEKRFDAQIPDTELSSENISSEDENISTFATETQGKYVPKSVEELNALYGEGKWVAINNRADLEAIPTNSNSSGKIYVLMSNIDLSGKDWEPIGYGTSYQNATDPFRGTLDGNGYTISNLTVNRPDEVANGLFGSISGATIKNLELKDVNIVGKENIGAISGQAVGSTIENCLVSGCVSGTYSGDGRNNGFVGGLIGVATSNTSFTNCASSADVSSKGRNTGGLVGHAYSTVKITNCYSTGDVSGQNCTGGIVGFPQNNITITNCYTTGNITGANNVGGIGGSSEGIVINNSYATGNITGTGSNVGGLSGGGNVTITNSFATGYPILTPSGKVTDSYGLTAQEGVEEHDVEWFNEGSNLTFLGGEYDYSLSPPQITSNPEEFLFPPPTPPPEPPDPDPPDTGPSKERSIKIQVGSQAGIDNTIDVKLEFTLDDLKINVSTEKDAEETLCAVEKLQETLLSKYSEIGAVQNRLDGILELQNNELTNLKSANSIIVDADIAQESCNLIKNQILNQAVLSLMSQNAKQSSNLALRLLDFGKINSFA